MKFTLTSKWHLARAFGASKQQTRLDELQYDLQTFEERLKSELLLYVVETLTSISPTNS